MSHLTFGLTPAPDTYGAVEIARRELEDIGLTAETIAKLAEKHLRYLDELEIPEGHRAAEKALPESIRAKRHLQKLALDAIQEKPDA